MSKCDSIIESRYFTAASKAPEGEPNFLKLKYFKGTLGENLAGNTTRQPCCMPAKSPLDLPVILQAFH